jgi:hypothetical protein
MMLKEKIKSDLIDCFIAIREDVNNGFAGYLGNTNEDFIKLIETTNLSEEQKQEFRSAMIHEVFDMVFCELYFRNMEREEYDNGSQIGDVKISLSELFGYHDLYQLSAEEPLNVSTIDMFTNWIVDNTPEDQSLETILISDRLDDGDTEYVEYEIGIKK